MMSRNQEISDLDLIIARAIEQNPQSINILQAFGPIIVRQRSLASSIKLTKLDFSSIDKKRLKAGVPVSRQINLFSPDENSLKEIALSLASAVKKGLPSLTEGIDRFCKFIQKKEINPADYFKVLTNDENKTVDGWSRNLEISPSNASFLMSLVARVVLENRAKEITAALGEFLWEKGYCPICGEFPSVALIEEDGGKRFLYCSSCGHGWRFTRVVCPYCENEAQKGMDYFYIENRTQESAFVCEKCMKYLITLYRAGNLHNRDMDISAISLVHLDMIMQEKGYAPMKVCVWNVLS
jgi:FdhE protein